MMHFAGYYVYFVVRLAHLRNEMRVKLKEMPSEELNLFEFTTEEFNKVKVNDAEIEVNGKMYDLARIESEGNRMKVYALHDETEDNLLAFIQEIVNTAAEDNDPAPSEILNLITLDYLTEDALFIAGKTVHQNHLTAYLDKLPTIEQRVETPPPRV